ncbi:MAG: M3 family peptidase, partial [Gammaproteobacteria bacterium]
MRHAPLIAMTTAFIATALSPAVTHAVDAPPNALNAPWVGPYGGVPPFDKASPALLAPALEAGIALDLAELQRIADDPAPPSFENTIAAMERAGRALNRAATVYGIYGATLSDDAVQAVERDIEPELAAFRDRIT